MRVSFFWCGAGMCLSAATWAKAPAADAASPVPAVAYRSVFTDTPKGVEAETLDWKAANAAVGQFTRGHVDILKWEAAHPQGDLATPTLPLWQSPGMEPKKP